MNEQDVLTRLKGVQRCGKGWKSLCPAHKDHDPSLSINIGEKGLILLHCFHNPPCPLEAILAAIGLSRMDLRQDDADTVARPQWHIVATYDYRDEDRQLLYQVCRTDLKTFPQRRPDPSAPGGWQWDLEGVRRVVYMLPELLEATAKGPGTQILIPEGEKDVKTVIARGFTATCNSGGAGKWRWGFRKWFAGANVVILPDKTDDGRLHALDVANSLHGVAQRVSILEVPDINGKTCKDVSDYFHAGGQTSDFIELVNLAAEWTPDTCSVAPEFKDVSLNYVTGGNYSPFLSIDSIPDLRAILKRVQPIKKKPTVPPGNMERTVFNLNKALVGVEKEHERGIPEALVEDIFDEWKRLHKHEIPSEWEEDAMLGELFYCRTRTCRFPGGKFSLVNTAVKAQKSELPGAVAMLKLRGMAVDLAKICFQAQRQNGRDETFFLPTPELGDLFEVSSARIAQRLRYLQGKGVIDLVKPARKGKCNEYRIPVEFMPYV